MPLIDKPLEELKVYRGISPVPADFDDYWTAALRELDERGDTVALCEAVDTAGIGLAVMNRMGRAAAFDIEQV